jgi:signal transduction histidine kinase
MTKWLQTLDPALAPDARSTWKRDFETFSAPDSETRAGALRAIQHAATRRAILTRQLIGVSRPQTSSSADADVDTVVATVQSLFKAVLPRRIELRVAPMARLRVALASEQLEQILLNLILNALCSASRALTRRDCPPLRLGRQPATTTIRTWCVRST